MRFRFALLLTTIVLAALSSTIEAEVLDHRVLRFEVVGSDGTRETYLVQYTANLDVGKWETGHPAAISGGKSVDARRCHWEVTRNMTRHVFFEHQRSGLTFLVEDLGETREAATKPESSTFPVQRTVPTSCESARGQFDRETEQQRSELTRLFQEYLGKERSELPALLKARLQAADASEISGK